MDMHSLRRRILTERSQRMLGSSYLCYMSSATVEVSVRGETVSYHQDDLGYIPDPSLLLKEVSDHINQLYACDGLDEFDRQSLEYFVRRLNFTDTQIQRLSAIWRDQFTESGKPENIRAEAAEFFTLESDY